MIKSIASQWRSINWRQLIPALVIQSVIWWYVPFQYAVQISTATFEYNLAFIFLYELAVAASSFLLFSTNFTSRFSLLTIIASGFLAFSGVIHGKFVIILLLLLLPAFLFLVQIKPLQLQNEYGLLIYSVLAALTLPSALAFLSVHFLSWSFIETLLPLLFSYLLFLTPVFLNKNVQKTVLLAMAFGIILILMILFRSLSLPSIIAIVLIIASWLVMNNFPKMSHPYLKYSFVQMLVVLLIYWS